MAALAGAVSDIHRFRLGGGSKKANYRAIRWALKQAAHGFRAMPSARTYRIITQPAAVHSGKINLAQGLAVTIREQHGRRPVFVFRSRRCFRHLTRQEVKFPWHVWLRLSAR